MPEKLSICFNRGREESVGNDDVSYYSPERTSSQIFDWKQYVVRHFFSLFGGIRLSSNCKQARRVSQLAERWTITEICRQMNSVLTYSQLTDFVL